jgi:hypothetical protein
MKRVAFLLMALACALADAHPWMTGDRLLQMLERPRAPADPVQGAAYLKGIEDATADRDWCYSRTKPGTKQLQPAALDLIRSLSPAEAQQSAALLAVRAWKKEWPCVPGCCHG